jgi:dienelactone hydrolase
LAHASVYRENRVAASATVVARSPPNHVPRPRDRADNANVALAAKVRQSGATFELFDYDAPGHLFADPAFPAYSRTAADLLTKRVLEFLARLNPD